jgi:hypothetical protein
MDIVSWSKPPCELAFTYDTLGSYLTEFVNVWNIKLGFAETSSRKNQQDFANFVVQNLDYIADDAIYVKNLRILFGITINVMGKLNPTSFGMIKKGVEVLLDKSYNLRSDESKKIRIDNDVKDFFTYQATSLKDKKQYVVIDGQQG